MQLHHPPKSNLLNFCKKYWLNVSLSLITVLVFVMNFNKEVINVNGGLGWDGRFYANAAENIDKLIAEKKIDAYRFQRTLVPLIIYTAFGISKVETNTANIITAYKIFNFIALSMSMVYFFLICKKLQLNWKLVTIGFASLFWCFPILKFPFFYPTLTDAAAFSIGLMIAYYYLMDNKIAFTICILLGSFVFPTFLLFFLLFIFKKEKVTNERSFYKKMILPGLFLLYFLFSFISLPDFFTPISSGCNPISKNLLVPSLLIVVLYFYFISGILPNLSIKEWFKKIGTRYLCVALGVAMLLQVLKYILASRKETFQASDYLVNVLQQSVTNPGAFLVAHTAYFGFFIILIAIAYREITQAILARGYGAALLFIGIAVLGIGSESRQLINFYPLVIVFILIALKEANRISTPFVLLYSSANLLIARFWQSIDLGSSLSEKDLIQYPAQNYFKFQGPWMSNATYMFNLVVLLVTAMIFFLLYKYNFFQNLLKVNRHKSQ